VIQNVVWNVYLIYCVCCSLYLCFYHGVTVIVQTVYLITVCSTLSVCPVTVKIYLVSHQYGFWWYVYVAQLFNFLLCFLFCLSSLCAQYNLCFLFCSPSFCTQYNLCFLFCSPSFCTQYNLCFLFCLSSLCAQYNLCFLFFVLLAVVMYPI
jgi:hypothetical protein